MESDELPDDARKLLRRAVEAGPNVTEPTVQTKVEKALQSLPKSQPPVLALAGLRVVMFMDVDGVVHAQGDSRYDDLTSSIVGQCLWRWWPQLRAVLDEYPDIEIVMHSSWRHIYPSLEWLRPVLPIDLAQRVVAITDSNIYSRFESIEAYLAAHPDVGAYVVLDDSESFPSHVPLVLCDSKRGMSDPAKSEELRSALAFAEAKAQVNWKTERRQLYTVAAINGAKAHPERLERALQALERWELTLAQSMQSHLSEWKRAIKTQDWDKLQELALHGHLNPLLVTLDPAERDLLRRRSTSVPPSQ